MHFRSAVLVAALIASPAIAHPKLVTSTPAAGAVVAAPAIIQLTFSEKLFEKMSGAKLMMAGMAGMPGHGAGPVDTSSALSADGKTMLLTPKVKLKAGSYKVEWFGVAGDTHRVTGAVDFSVR
jgi:methionine-rich copper-binding protein CopC